MLRIKPMTLQELGKITITEQRPQPSVILKTESSYVALAQLKLSIPLPLPTRCWGYVVCQDAWPIFMFLCINIFLN
jgi:hypothetical protein